MKICSLLIVSLAFIGCSRGNKDAKVLKIAIPDRIRTLDPIHGNDSTSQMMIGSVFGTLMTTKYLDRPFAVEPLLAESFPTISPDGLLYTFKIRHGIKFHPSATFKDQPGGREVTADDFIYSWKRLADMKTKTNAFWLFDGKILGMNKFREASSSNAPTDYSLPIQGLRAIDPYTLEIRLEKPYPQLLFMVATTYSAVVAKEVVEFYKDDFLNHPVGTGPFILEEYEPASNVFSLKRNPNFVGTYPKTGEPADTGNGFLEDSDKQLPLVDRIDVQVIADEPARMAAFKKGTLDFIDVSKVESVDEKLGKTVGEPGPNVRFLGLNMDDPVLGKHKKIRQAIALTIDRGKLLQIFTAGKARLAEGLLPPGISGFDPELKSKFGVRDIGRAKQLLTEAGFPQGKGLPVLRMDVRNDTQSRQFAEIVQKDLAEINITIQIETNTWNQLLEKIRRKQSQIFQVGWQADYPDPENFLQVFYGKNTSPGPNPTNFQNNEYDSLYERFGFALDTPERRAKIRTMQEILNEEVPAVFLYHELVRYQLGPRVKNFKPNGVLPSLWQYLGL